jgi:hypothetical protein
VQIPKDRLLPLEKIAKLWAHELRGTPLEERADALLNRLRMAFYRGHLNVPGPDVKELQELSYKLLSAIAAGEKIDPTVGWAVSSQVGALKISRADFLRWTEEDGWPHPTFWDEPTDEEKTRRKDREAELDWEVLKHDIREEPPRGAAVLPAPPAEEPPPEGKDLTPLEACVKQLLDQGIDPGGGEHSWKTFQLIVQRAAPRQKGLSTRNLKRIVKDLRGR